jgi:hypothetical protein
LKAIATESENLTERCKNVMKYTSNPLEYAVALRTYKDSLAVAIEAYKKQLKNESARLWCENLLETLPEPVKKRP